MIKFLSVFVCISSHISTYKAIVWTPENKISMRAFFCWLSSCVPSWGNVKVQVHPRESFLRDAWPRSLPDSWSNEGPTENHRAAGRRWPLGSLVQPPAWIRTIAISRSGQPWLYIFKSQDVQGWRFDSLPRWPALVLHHLQEQHNSAGIQQCAQLEPKTQGGHWQVA